MGPYHDDPDFWDNFEDGMYDYDDLPEPDYDSGYSRSSYYGDYDDGYDAPDIDYGRIDRTWYDGSY